MKNSYGDFFVDIFSKHFLVSNLAMFGFAFDFFGVTVSRGK